MMSFHINLDCNGVLRYINRPMLSGAFPETCSEVSHSLLQAQITDLVFCVIETRCVLHSRSVVFCTYRPAIKARSMHMMEDTSMRLW